MPRYNTQMPIAGTNTFATGVPILFKRDFFKIDIITSKLTAAHNISTLSEKYVEINSLLSPKLVAIIIDTISVEKTE